MTLNPTIKAKWLADLRSGNYPQAREYLRKGNGDAAYCCLGVLCLSVGASFVDGFTFNDDEGYRRHFDNVPILNDENLGYNDDPELSTAFRKRIGLSDEDHSLLIKMNDGGKTFAEIADYIEKHL